MFGIIWSLLSVIFFATMSGYFALMEVAITESKQGKLEKIVQDEKILEVITNLLDEPEKSLSVAKIGMTAVSILSGIFIIPLSNGFYDKLNFFEQALPVSIVLALFFVLFVIIFFGIFLPSKTAEQTPEELLLTHYKSFLLTVKLLSPVEEIFSKIAKGFMTLFGMNVETSDTVTEDEVEDLIEQGTEDGTFEESEREMVDKIFYLSDQTAYALMTPRIHITWLDLTDSVEQNLKIVREHNENIFPVGEGSLDNCRGVIYAKDLLDAALDAGENDKKIELTSLIKKPLFVPRTMETFRLVEKFKSGGDSAAIVNDEYGGVVGFITLDDIAKEIVGLDTEQPEERQIFMQQNNSWIVDGLFDIDDFKKQFGFETLPDEERDHFQTMGGFLTSRFGYIPKVGESKEWNNLKFEVMNMDGARIAKILITKLNR